MKVEIVGVLVPPLQKVIYQFVINHPITNVARKQQAKVRHLNLDLPIRDPKFI